MKVSVANRKLSDNKKEMLFSELYSLLSAGLDFSRSFEMLIEVEKEDKDIRMLKTLYSTVVKGSGLCSAMQQSGAFSPLDYGVIKIGEETGRLCETLSFLCGYYKKKDERIKMVRGAVSYPAIILVTAITVVTFMIMVIVPMFEQVYARMGGELPAITQFIIRISEKFPLFIIVVILMFLTIGIWVYTTWNSEQTKKLISDILLEIPFVNDAIKKNTLVAICKLLALLLASGVPLMAGIMLLEEVIEFYPYRKSFGQIARDLEKGEPLFASLAKYPRLYSKKFIALLKVGEESNSLCNMLQKQGNELTSDLEYRLKFIGNLIEPVLILLVGAAVALILVSMYLPMFKLSGIMA